MKYRIISNGYKFKVQTKKWFFWRTVQRPPNDAEKDFGGDMCFDSLDAAKAYASQRWTWTKYQQVFP